MLIHNFIEHIPPGGNLPRIWPGPSSSRVDPANLGNAAEVPRHQSVAWGPPGDTLPEGKAPWELGSQQHDPVVDDLRCAQILNPGATVFIRPRRWRPTIVTVAGQSFAIPKKQLPPDLPVKVK